MAKIKLHPLHLMLVHFPSALLPVDLIFSVFAAYSHNDDLAKASYYCLMAGTIGGWFAVITGIADLFKYLLKQNEAIKPGLVHAGIQVMTIVGFTVLLGLEYKNQSYILSPPLWLWISKTFLLAAIFAGNFLGAELLMNYTIKQVKASPK